MSERKYKKSLCWIRRDLRTYDHAALSAATHGSEEVAVVFVFDTCILDELEDKDDRRLTFIYKSLEEVDKKLQDHGSKLIYLHGDPTSEIPQLAKKLGIDAVFTARDYEPYAKTRDSKVKELLGNENIDFVTVKDTVMMEGGEVLSKVGEPIRVYTPYRRAWGLKFDPKTDGGDHIVDFNYLMPKSELAGSSKNYTLKDLGFTETDLWLEPGEKAGRHLLADFSKRMTDYDDDRDFPAKHGTSELSVHFRFGTVSIRDAARHALEHENRGSDRWLNELVWRDFYQDILFHNPQVVHEPFQPQYKHLDYPGEPEHWDVWAEGNTGYPLIDAAMRCFNQTGYMHNRLRMVVASFLTKDLLLDYRKGEAYFARFLLDFDLASNNGGWQWASSVGADPQPYFRIFNPILQSKKFDPDGDFIRHYVPEIKGLSGASIHFPPDATEMELTSNGIELGKTYPNPIVDHSTQRDKAVKLLERAKNSAKT